MIATWSGVYYVQAQEDDAFITFLDSNKEFNWSWLGFKENNEYNITFSIMSKTGRLLFISSIPKNILLNNRIKTVKELQLVLTAQQSKDSYGLFQTPGKT